MTTLAREVAGVRFANPLLLASGTAGFGREVSGVIDLTRIGGLVTKAVSLEPRDGNAPPRVGELDGGMINAVGLANPGVTQVLRQELPWLQRECPALPVLVNVVGFRVEEYRDVIAQLESASGHAGYEINLSCPNTSAGGVEFGADTESVRAVITLCRAATRRPLFAKLSPALPNIPAIAAAARDAGADGVSLVNTMPGWLDDGGHPRLGNGFGGVSGPALRPAGLLAVRRTAAALPGFPIIGVGGIATAQDVRAYLDAGAVLVAIGTAALIDPRIPERILNGLSETHA